MFSSRHALTYVYLMQYTLKYTMSHTMQSTKLKNFNSPELSASIDSSKESSITTEIESEQQTDTETVTGITRPERETTLATEDESPERSIELRHNSKIDNPNYDSEEISDESSIGATVDEIGDSKIEIEPFSTFLKKLLSVLSIKRVPQLIDLKTAFWTYIRELLTQGDLDVLGPETKAYIDGLLQNLKNAPTDELRRNFSELQLKLTSRKKDSDDILAYMDDMFQVQEEKAMKESLKDVIAYPYSHTTAEEIAQRLVKNVLLQPMRRVTHTRQGDHILNLITELVESRHNPHQIPRQQMYVNTENKHLNVNINDNVSKKVVKMINNINDIENNLRGGHEENVQSSSYNEYESYDVSDTINGHKPKNTFENLNENGNEGNDMNGNEGKDKYKFKSEFQSELKPFDNHQVAQANYINRNKIPKIVQRAKVNDYKNQVTLRHEQGNSGKSSVEMDSDRNDEKRSQQPHQKIRYNIKNIENIFLKGQTNNEQNGSNAEYENYGISEKNNVYMPMTNLEKSKVEAGENSTKELGNKDISKPKIEAQSELVQLGNHEVAQANKTNRIKVPNITVESATGNHFNGQVTRSHEKRSSDKSTVENALDRIDEKLLQQPHKKLRNNMKSIENILLKGQTDDEQSSLNVEHDSYEISNSGFEASTSLEDLNGDVTENEKEYTNKEQGNEAEYEPKAEPQNELGPFGNNQVAQSSKTNYYTISNITVERAKVNNFNGQVTPRHEKSNNDKSTAKNGPDRSNKKRVQRPHQKIRNNVKNIENILHKGLTNDEQNSSNDEYESYEISNKNNGYKPTVAMARDHVDKGQLQRPNPAFRVKLTNSNPNTQIRRRTRIKHNVTFNQHETNKKKVQKRYKILSNDNNNSREHKHFDKQSKVAQNTKSSAWSNDETDKSDEKQINNDMLKQNTELNRKLDPTASHNKFLVEKHSPSPHKTDNKTQNVTTKKLVAEMRPNIHDLKYPMQPKIPSQSNISDKKYNKNATLRKNKPNMTSVRKRKKEIPKQREFEIYFDEDGSKIFTVKSFVGSDEYSYENSEPSTDGNSETRESEKSIDLEYYDTTVKIGKQFFPVNDDDDYSRSKNGDAQKLPVKYRQTTRHRDEERRALEHQQKTTPYESLEFYRRNYGKIHPYKHITTFTTRHNSARDLLAPR